MTPQEVLTSDLRIDTPAVELDDTASLSEFLTRPFVIDNFDWAEGNMLNRTLTPYSSLLNQPAIKKKLSGYRLFQAGIELTVTMSSSPFLYSGVLVAYAPLTVAENTFGLADPIVPSGTSSYLPLQMSTFPYHLFMYPQSDTTATMSIPWICPTDYISLVDRPSMGSLVMYSVTPLRSVGTPSASTCTISVIARFINPKLAGPTATELQSGTAMGLSKDLARVGFGAASAVASSAGHILKLVGMTNEATKGDVQSVASNILPGLSSGEQSVPVANMGLGLSMPAEDSDLETLDIARLAAIPSYLGEASWTLSAAVNQQLIAIGVSPAQYNSVERAGSLDATVYYDISPAMCAYISSFFRLWSGTMCFKFKVICSQYHRGKVRVWYDNSGLTTTPTEGYLKSQMLDLATDSELTVRIPMASQTPWLYTEPVLLGVGSGVPPQYKHFSTTNVTYDSRKMNGMLRMEVCQKLSALDALGNVLIGVWAWMEDAKFADPYCGATSGGGPVTLVSPIAWQSGIVSMAGGLILPPDPPVPATFPPPITLVKMESGNVDIGMTPAVVDLSGARTHSIGGLLDEDITSLKELAHRATFYKSLTVPLTTTTAATPGARSYASWVLPRVPRYFGPEYSSGYVGPCEKMANGTAFNMVGSTYLGRIAAMFYGYKGSVRWHVAVAPATSVGAVRTLSVSRGHYTPGIFVSSAASGSSSQTNQVSCWSSYDLGAGKAVCTSNYPSLTVDAPDYYPVKFLPTTPFGIQDNTSNLLAGRYSQTGTVLTGSDTINIVLSAYNSTGTYFNGDKNVGDTIVDTYVSAAPNFRFVHFKGVPLLSYCPNKVAPVLSSTY